MPDVRAYLDRIGYEGEVVPTAETLSALQYAHLLTVPFENLDIHLGRRIVLDEERLFAKIVRGRRGGFCYELNGLFAALLRQLGFAVTLLGAQFPTDGRVTYPELDHLTLLVAASDASAPFLVDVGSGRGGFARPLLTGTEAPQEQPEVGAAFRLLSEGDGARLWRQEPGGDWEPQYRFSWQPRQFADFREGCDFHQTSPDSHFTQKPLITLMTPNGRVTLSEYRLIVTSNGHRVEEELSLAAYDDALRTLFGIDLSALSERSPR